MVKQTIWAGLAIFVAWTILDFVLHGLLLRSTYEATASLWRPLNELNQALIFLVTLVLIACFVLIYALLVGPKSRARGLRYGALFGLATGIAAASGPTFICPFRWRLRGVGSWEGGQEEEKPRVHR